MPNSAPTSSIRQAVVVALVEDDPLVRLGLKDILEDRGWTVDDYETGEAFLMAFAPGRAACLLLDSRLPGIPGIEVLRRLRQGGHRQPTIVITGDSDIRTAVSVMKAGALDFIEKPVLGVELIAAVERCLDQGSDTGKASAWQAAAALRIGALTARQHKIMTRVLAGQPNKNIAADLGVSQRTVENHRAQIMKRTQSASLPELTRLALAATWSEGIDPVSGVVEPAPAPAEATAAQPPPALLDSEQFRRFFDAVPMAILIGAMAESETIIYANPAFEALSGQSLSQIEGKAWTCLNGADAGQPKRGLGEAIVTGADRVGTFALPRESGEAVTVDAYVNVIVDDNDRPAFRLAVLIGAGEETTASLTDLEEKIRDRDMMILEIQHRVKNNLQMITSLIRIEARNPRSKSDKTPLDRLEGRINSIQIIYRLLSEFSQSDEIDLGVYLSEIASAVMHSHAVEGIRLDLKVDAYPVSVNVALPTGLVANELLTNALKHAFVGRDGGTITLHSLTDASGCRVTIADDGVGLPTGVVWPRQGKLGELIVRSLRQNARADLQVNSAPGGGTRVTIAFSRAAADPATAA
jgi:PAS domain S-box-containing protein